MDWNSVESADDCLEVHPLGVYHCPGYMPGHEMHWIHAKRLHNNPSSPVAKVTLRRGLVEVAFANELAPVLWWHHDRDRLIAALRGSDEDELEAWPKWHALRVGRAYFNCSDTPTACTGRSLREGR
jgi:hypothetical protein